ncbi:MAG TPA: hypothetical protein VIM34_02300 [Burkholderiaceae bacterium]
MWRSADRGLRNRTPPAQCRPWRWACEERVAIAPGLAFDQDGNEIFVGQPVTLALPAPSAVLPMLRYEERLCRIEPVIANELPHATDGAASTQPTNR